MAELIFEGFLPNEEKPENFEEFRSISSEVYGTINGSIKFSYIKALQQFEIIENNTIKNEIELKNMLGINTYFLV